MNTPHFRRTLIAVGVVASMVVGTGAFAQSTTLASKDSKDGIQPAYCHVT